MMQTVHTWSLDRVLTASIAVICGLAASSAVLAEEPAFTRSAESPELAWGPCPAFMPDDCRISVLHGDPAKPASDIFFKLPAGAKVPAHWHNSAERMVLVSGRMQVDYEGQEPVVLEAGVYAYGPPRLEHHATCSSDEDCVLFIAFEEPLDAFASD